jgi:hypothetical protein
MRFLRAFGTGDSLGALSTWVRGRGRTLNDGIVYPERYAERETVAPAEPIAAAVSALLRAWR